MFNGQHIDRKDCEMFNGATLQEIQSMAQVGLSRAEILEGFSVDWADVKEADRIAFNHHYNYGRALGLKQMGESLFVQARSKQGTAASLAFLARFAQEWKKDIDTGTGDTNFNFTMKI